ncbi:ATP-binding protein [Streptomyces sp. SID3212]|uniref:ATP-binding protein n=1 Tax=Streptomyces sp. SID3212 TaxID=2690259 RepID=UPI00136990AE|nr:ATP-binding protein [Streptomyces sp. SID3212]MYV55480.1 ATP-binding protein [Streptomyces sp. SID3212]
MSRLRGWDRLTLAAVPTAACCARTFTKCTLRWWEATDVMDDALLIISELVTNAVKATGPNTPDPTWSDVRAEHVLGVQLRVVDMNLYVEVWDRAGEIPTPKAPSADDEGGRGLLLVQSLTRRWGTFRPPAGGKIVWAELPLTKAPDLTPQTPPLPHRVPSEARAPEGKTKTQVETALMERVLEGLRRL